jgi:uncharacterized protein (DUF1501 family)
LPEDAGRAAAFDALRAGGTQANMLERAYADSTNRAIANAALINAAMVGTRLATPFPDTDLGNQLAAIALMIKVRGSLGMSRQVFFASVGSYDTHGTQLADQNSNLGELSDALAAFHAATVEMGIQDGVTAFTASDFGRSLAINSDGTDHGWGAHHLVVGGAVRGAAFYGSAPPVSNTNTAAPEDQWHVGQGRLLPSTSVDQYAGTLARWFGVADSEMAGILPNLRNFGGSGYPVDLGFMAP